MRNQGKNLMKRFKILFMGTPDFAVPSLENLISDGHNIVGVVTQPDRKRGRGGAMSFSPVKKAAVLHDLKIFQPGKIRNKEMVEKLRELDPDLFITCAYGQILSQALLDIPRLGCINVHASLLPEYRGAAPIHRAVMNGDKTTGITTMMTDRGMDTGDILLRSEIEIDDNMTSGELHDILKTMGADLISKTLGQLSDGTLVSIPQDDGKATYAPMLKKEESVVDWECGSKEIHDKARALNPWPGCFTTYKGKRMRIIKAGFNERIHEKKPGTIVSVGKKTIEVACGVGCLAIYELQFANKKPMRVTQCWHNIENGAVLGRENRE